MARHTQEDRDDGSLPPALMAEVLKAQLKWKTVRAAVIGFSVALSIFAVWPLAAALAGTDTSVNVNLAISLTITLAITTTGAAAWARQQHKNAKSRQGRVLELEAKNRVLEQENKSLRGRIEGLSSDLDQLRADRALPARKGKRE